jgi:geranylgeranyl reductase family protein
MLKRPYSMIDYDVIVVGGGPAGSTTARRTAQQGLNVLLLDKECCPRVKPCAGGLVDPAREALDFSIDDIVQRRINGQTIHAPSGLQVDCSRPTESGVTVLRPDFDQLLLKKAEEAGATVYQDERVTKVVQDESSVHVTTHEKKQYTAKYVVGADGVNSVVAKQLGFYNGWKDNTAATAIEMEIEVGQEAVERVCAAVNNKDRATLHIFFGPIPFGYTWCFPKKSILSVGAGCRQDKAQKLRQNFKTWYNQFKKLHHLHPKTLSYSGARLPFLRPAEATVKNRAILVGDAAGFVNPFDGEGIQMAIRSGVVAAPILKSAVEANDPSELGQYETEWKKQFDDLLTIGRKLAAVLYKSEKNMETICQLGAEDSVINEIMYKMIASTDSYGALYTELRNRILTKHPRAGISLFR